MAILGWLQLAWRLLWGGLSGLLGGTSKPQPPVETPQDEALNDTVVASTASDARDASSVSNGGPEADARAPDQFSRD
jgi:hypothetical protein